MHQPCPLLPYACFFEFHVLYVSPQKMTLSRDFVAKLVHLSDRSMKHAKIGSSLKAKAAKRI